MICKIYKLFAKISSTFGVIIINILIFSILFLYSESAFSKDTNIERILAFKYCDSIEKKLFKGLDNEKILKYEYFFNSINEEVLYEKLNGLSNFPSEVKTICKYKISFEEEEELKRLLNDFLSNN